MAPPRNIPKFPTYEERLSLMEELKQATEAGDALASGQYLKQYVEKLKQLNELIPWQNETDKNGHKLQAGMRNIDRRSNICREEKRHDI